MVTVCGRTCRRGEILKHDSWAATAIYEDEAGTRITCKFNRRQPIFLLPTGWLGRRLAARESWFLRELADIETVPDDLGPVRVAGEVQPHALARVYIAGAPLMKFQPVGDNFFPELLTTLAAMHRRGLAHVDMNKKENVIVGADGRPHLIDFQISFRPPRGWLGTSWPIRSLHRQLAAADLLHFIKHVGDCRPDQFGTRGIGFPPEPPALLRLHRRAIKPLRATRRRLLVALGVRSGAGHAETELEPEDAVRRRLRRE
jgi:hypothetical protein